MNSKSEALMAGFRQRGQADGRGDVLAVLLAHGGLGGADVGPVDGETGDHLAQGRLQAKERVILRPAVLFGNPLETASQRMQLARHGDVQDQLLALVRHLLGMPGATGTLGIDLLQGVLAIGINEEAIQEVEEVIPGGAVHRPLGAEPFIAAEDLLDDDIAGGLGTTRR